MHHDRENDSACRYKPLLAVIPYIIGPFAERTDRSASSQARATSQIFAGAMPSSNIGLATVILLVYSLHNGWNCWVFLNFTNFAPAQELLNVSAEEIGLLTTVGFVGILFGLPFATLCTYQRTVLVTGGALNAAAPVLRYYAVLGGHGYIGVLVSSFLQGVAFGLIGAWPAMLAALQWAPQHRTLVTAVASLSNYVGGAAGTIAMPIIADSAASLLEVFRLQALACVPLTLALASWLWLPPADDAAAHGARSVRGELERCCRTGRNALLLFAFGSAVGVSLALQGTVQHILEGSGFTAVEAGVANTCYQLAAAVVGVLLSRCIASPRALPPTVRALQLVAAASLAGLTLLCAVVGRNGRNGRLDAAAILLVLCASVLGGSLLGMLPFVLQVPPPPIHPFLHAHIPTCSSLFSPLRCAPPMSPFLHAHMPTCSSLFSPLRCPPQLGVAEIGAAETTVSGAIYLVAFVVVHATPPALHPPVSLATSPLTRPSVRVSPGRAGRRTHPALSEC